MRCPDDRIVLPHGQTGCKQFGLISHLTISGAVWLVVVVNVFSFFQNMVGYPVVLQWLQVRSWRMVCAPHQRQRLIL